MKKQGIILLIATSCLLVAGLLLIYLYNSNLDKRLESLTYATFNDKIENNESFILFIGSKSCSHCIEFLPTFKRALNEVDLTAYYIDTTSFTKDEIKELEKVVNYDGTPTVAFITDGKENTMRRLVGSGHSMSKVIERFKKAGFVK